MLHEATLSVWLEETSMSLPRKLTCFINLSCLQSRNILPVDKVQSIWNALRWYIVAYTECFFLQKLVYNWYAFQIIMTWRQADKCLAAVKIIELKCLNINTILQCLISLNVKSICIIQFSFLFDSFWWNNFKVNLNTLDLI